MISLQDLSFVEAKQKDFKIIVEIHNSNVRGQQKLNSNGFLLAKTSEEEIQNNVEHLSQYFVAINGFGEILGFLAIAKPKITPDFLNQIRWIDASYEDKLLSEKHLYINLVATHLDYRGQGVAQFMYRFLYEKFPDALLSAFIVTKPLLNQRSIQFHEKQGFQAIAIFQKDTFLDLQHYESVLMLKQL